MTYVPTDEHKRVMTDAAERAYPDEACGVVAGGVCYELPNADPGRSSFGIRAADLAEVATRHGGYEAVWHSHPSGDPLPSSRDWAYHPDAKAMVVVAGREVNVYYGDPT